MAYALVAATDSSRPQVGGRLVRGEGRDETAVPPQTRHFPSPLFPPFFERWAPHPGSWAHRYGRYEMTALKLPSTPPIAPRAVPPHGKVLWATPVGQSPGVPSPSRATRARHTIHSVARGMHAGQSRRSPPPALTRSHDHRLIPPLPRQTWETGRRGTVGGRVRAQRIFAAPRCVRGRRGGGGPALP